MAVVRVVLQRGWRATEPPPRHNRVPRRHRRTGCGSGRRSRSRSRSRCRRPKGDRCTGDGGGCCAGAGAGAGGSGVNTVGPSRQRTGGCEAHRLGRRRWPDHAIPALGHHHVATAQVGPLAEPHRGCLDTHRRRAGMGGHHLIDPVLQVGAGTQNRKEIGPDHVGLKFGRIPPDRRVHRRVSIRVAHPTRDLHTTLDGLNPVEGRSGVVQRRFRQPLASYARPSPVDEGNGHVQVDAVIDGTDCDVAVGSQHVVAVLGGIVKGLVQGGQHRWSQHLRRSGMSDVLTGEDPRQSWHRAGIRAEVGSVRDSVGRRLMLCPLPSSGDHLGCEQ